VNQELFNALVEERSIFAQFNSRADTAEYELFYSPDSSQVPHWNLAYPKGPFRNEPSAAAAEEISGRYRALGVAGHFASEDPRFAALAAEESEYFRLAGPVDAEPLAPVDEVDNHESGLTAFCDTVQLAFSFTQETRAYFEKKMRILAERAGSRFYVVKRGQEVMGACSTFRTVNGADFLFNVATLPAYQGRGVARSVIQYAAKQSVRPLYTYSHNPAMRQNILPTIGFRSLGVLYCVPLSAAGKARP
jgi:GNAT superfamily N-acetyltransferase